MKREPSIHVTEKNLALVLKDVLVEYYDMKIDNKLLAQLLVQKAKSLPANGRSIIVSNDKLEKKTKVILSASKKDAFLMADIIYYVRKKKRHRGVTKIDQNHREWGQLKKLTNCCIEFCNEFELPKRRGFIEYVTNGMNLITSTRGYIGKLISMQERLSNEYELVILIEDDENAKETRLIHDYYISMIVNKTGLREDYRKQPTKYINFLKVREITDEMDIPFDIYLKAQFFGLAWADSYPEPTQLVGDKAKERLNKYMYKNKLKKTDKKKPKAKVNVLLRIKESEKNKNQTNKQQV